MVQITFASDGHYTAAAGESYPPFYYDYDPANSCGDLRHWDLTGLSVVGIDGLIELPDSLEFGLRLIQTDAATEAARARHHQ